MLFDERGAARGSARQLLIVPGGELIVYKFARTKLALSDRWKLMVILFFLRNRA